MSIPVYSPVSGLVLSEHDPFHGSHSRFLSENENKAGTKDSFMYAILLPKNTSVSETIEQSVAEFCDLCWQYRQSVFRNRDVLQTVDLSDVKEEEREKQRAKAYSNERINGMLSEYRQRKIIVRELSSVPDEYKEQVEKLRQKYPKNFQS